MISEGYETFNDAKESSEYIILVVSVALYFELLLRFLFRRSEFSLVSLY